MRGPASHCGVVGLRPTLGLVSRHGIVPARLNRDVPGPIARTVTDMASHCSLLWPNLAACLVSTAIGQPLVPSLLAKAQLVQVKLFEQMIGYDAQDNLTNTITQNPPPAKYTQFLDASALTGARIGVIRSISNVPFADSDTLSIFEQAIDDLARNGVACSAAQQTCQTSLPLE